METWTMLSLFASRQSGTEVTLWSTLRYSTLLDSVLEKGK